MDELVKAAKESLSFRCEIGEDFEDKLRATSLEIAQKYGFDHRADGLMAILLRHPKATQEWLDSIDLVYGDGVSQVEQKAEDTQSAVGWLMSLVGIFDSEEEDPKD